MSTELDLCYVEATAPIRLAARQVISQGDCESELKKELQQWLAGLSEGGREREGKKQQSAEYHNVGLSISFDLVVKIHQQLKVNPLASGPVYLHELMEGSSLCLPELKFPPRNPELVARLERVQVTADNKAYQRMVKNVDVSRDDSEFYRLGLEVQATSRQIWTMVNFLLTVVGGFMFGFFAAYYASFSTPVCVSVGLIFGTVVFMADLYFIVRTDLVSPKHSKRKSQVKHKEKSD